MERRAWTHAVLLAVVLFSWILLASRPADARGSGNVREVEPVSDEYRFKAAYIYNFLGYTTWPKGTFEKSDTPIEVLLIGKDPFGKILDDTFKGKQIDKRSVRITRSKAVPKEIKAHVVFCSGLGEKDKKSLITMLKKRPVLLIGEDKGFAEAGATINFYLEKTKLRFEINTDASKAAGLTISSQLLKLAKIVKTKEEKQ